MNDFYETLHDDDQIAFTELVAKLDKDLADRLELLHPEADQRSAHMDYMNKVVAAAKALEIEEVAKYALPERDYVFQGYDDFTLVVQRVCMEIGLRKVRTGKVYSVALDPASKERIHVLVKKIREVIESADLEEKKKNSLFAKLNAFDADVDRSRTPFGNAMLMALDVAHVVKTYGEALNPLNELLKRINEMMSDAKSKEPEQTQLPPPEEKKKLEPPPKKIEHKPPRDMDDDIPF